MCFSKLFGKPKTPMLPHPEEPINNNATIDNINPGDLIYIINKWFNDWKVPVESHPFWLSVKITLVPKLTILYNGQFIQVPAATWPEEKRMELDPQWANPGVLAHEFAHISYSMLKEGDKMAFESHYTTLLKTDPLLMILDAQNSYMNTSTIEDHADVYRYLGEQMPESLKQYFLKLF